MSRQFMLDTDSVSFALRGQGRVASRIVEHRPSEICLSAITVAELRYGADRRKSKKLHHLIDVLVANMDVMPFDERCATTFGSIASDLARRGSAIGEFDVLIAAHAMTLGVTLVTNNTKHFNRVRGLEVENWT